MIADVKFVRHQVPSSRCARLFGHSTGTEVSSARFKTSCAIHPYCAERRFDSVSVSRLDASDFGPKRRVGISQVCYVVNTVLPGTLCVAEFVRHDTEVMLAGPASAADISALADEHQAAFQAAPHTLQWLLLTIFISVHSIRKPSSMRSRPVKDRPTPQRSLSASTAWTLPMIPTSGAKTPMVAQRASSGTLASGKMHS